jgi:subtilisin family serine protease
MLNRQRFWVLAFTILLLILGGLVLTLSLQAAPAASAGPRLPQASPLLEAIRQGKYPAQLASSTGAIRPDRHGPQRNDPAEGIPVHAYSPFDERRNRDYPCPPGGCEFQKGRVLIKLAPQVKPRRLDVPGAWTEDTVLNETLAAQGVLRLEQVFPQARPPQPGEFVVSPQGERLPKPDLTRWYRAVLADEQADVYAVVQALSEAPSVEYAEPDYLRKLAEEPGSRGAREQGSTGASERGNTREFSSTPQHLRTLAQITDPLYAQQWHLSATNVPQAWQWLADHGLPPGGNRDIVVAVIDTGVDLNHPDLTANLWTNSREIPGNGVDDDGNGYVDDVHGVDVIVNSGNPMDDHGHGTHVAGIIAAQANNGIGGVGVAYNVQLMAIKAAQYSGVLASSDIAEAIYYAVAQGADVLNMSFGGYARSQVEEDALAVAFGQAVLVAAAGNDGKVNLPCPFGRDMYPAAYNWVLGVMARQPNPDAQGDYLASFSNYDCKLQDSHEYELMAPGVDVWSTLPNEQYAAWDGTSMAAPVVSGIAALARTKWADKDVYSSRFIMGQLATTGGLMQAYTPPQGLPVSYYVPNALLALTTTPQPKLSYLEHWTFDTTAQAPGNDDDGIVDAGETVDLAIVIRNHWGKAESVTVTLEAWAAGAFQPDPYVTMITGTVDYGAVGSFNIDDNGLIYASDVIMGVRNPFRFRVDANTPNDHLIPFRLTMVAGNGYDPGAAPLTFVSRFNLIVQRGRELPYIIEEDMVLTKDYYWLVSDASLIASGATVTVTEGTQLQFFSADPSDPYSENARPYLQVEGTLLVQGTAAEPVEMFTGLLYQGYPIQIRQIAGGSTTLQYARIVNPVLGRNEDVYTGAGSGLPLDLIEHVYFSQDLYDCIWRFAYWEPTPYWQGCYEKPVANAASIRQSIFRGIGYRPDGLYLRMNSPVSMSLFDSSVIQVLGASEGSVFLKNYKLPTSGDAYWVSRATTGRLNDGLDNDFTSNAILNVWWDPDINHWMRFYMDQPRDYVRYLTNNYWGTTATTLIDAAIQDFSDDFNLGQYVYQPVLTTPVTTTYPFVVDVALSTASNPRTSIVGAEPVTFTVTFNRDMTTTIQPQVSFGPDVPFTDYTIHPINGGWRDTRTWVGAFNINPITGDGYQLIRVAGAVAADDQWLVTGDDAGRFRFEIITSGTEAMNLQATGGEGRVELSWTQNDFDLLSGFNLYRATTITGTTYTRINSSIIPPQQRASVDSNVQPGQPYYYKFTIVKSDMSESDFSNVATATPLDTIPPILTHTPVTSATPGLALTLSADVTDNVAVTGVALYYRAIGATSYLSRTMTLTTGNRYSATIEGSRVTSPGLEYYIEATDGISRARAGRSDFPYQIAVVDRPVVTAVSPNRGPASGGTNVTIAGSNFKAGATVNFGGAAASNVTFISSSQITCITPPHYPATVDVTVTNPDSQSGTLLRGYTYESEIASLSLPNTGGEQHAVVQVPINAANVNGLAAASLTVAFDSNVLSARDASTGNLTPGWSVAANTNTPGQIRLSMASPGGTVTGSGVLAYLEFEVVGSPGASTTLQLTNVSLNDGAIPVETADGSFAVSLVYDVAGTVRFWNGGAGVPGVLFSLQGDRVYTGLSDANGAYTVSGAETDDYTLTPSKSDGVNGISAYDASQALQHDAGLITLSGYAATAGDVNKNGSITSMDAFYILQKSVDLITLPFPGAGVVWDFSPPSRSYPNLSSNQSGQDFTAVLLGDVSGNWNAAGGQSMSVLAQGPVTLTVVGGHVSPSGLVTATLWLDAVQVQVYSLDLALSYSPTAASAVSIQSGPLAAGFALSANLSQPGEVRMALAGALPISRCGELLTLTFQMADSSRGGTDLLLTQGDVNEGAISAHLIHGRLGVWQLYVPLVFKGYGGR